MDSKEGKHLPIILLILAATVLIIVIGVTGVKTDDGDGSIALIATIAFFAILISYNMGKDK